MWSDSHWSTLPYNALTTLHLLSDMSEMGAKFWALWTSMSTKASIREKNMKGRREDETVLRFLTFHGSSLPNESEQAYLRMPMQDAVLP